MKRRGMLKKLIRAGLLLILMSGTGCGDLLEVRDPDLVTSEKVKGARGADLIWAGALWQFANAFSGHGDGQALTSGLFADEYHFAKPGVSDVDLRKVVSESGAFRLLHRARVGTGNAAGYLEEVNPSDPRIGEMWALSGFTYLMLGEDFCSGVPFGEVTLDGSVTNGESRTTEEIFQLAMERFDWALEKAAGDPRLENLARVGAGRALMDLGRFAEAARAVAQVPTDWRYPIHYGEENWNRQYTSTTTNKWISLSDREGMVGLPFRSANDPRVPWIPGGKGADGQTPHYQQLKFSSVDSEVTLASGVEARLIEAEAALADEDVETFLARLNGLRETFGLDQIGDPGTPDSRVDRLFHERAFTLFGEGRRLGDLRRLVRQYGRSAQEVFPSGPYHKGGSYGTDVNLAIPTSEEGNPNFSGCLDRGA